MLPHIEPPSTDAMLPHMERLLSLAHASVVDEFPRACLDHSTGDCVVHVGALLVSTLILLGEKTGLRAELLRASMIALHVYLGVQDHNSAGAS